MSMDALKIAALCKGRYHIKVLQETDSTNARLRAMAMEGAPEGVALFALSLYVCCKYNLHKYFSP